MSLIAVKEVKGDGGYDLKAKVRRMIREKGNKSLIPPQKDAKKGVSKETDHAISIIKGLGGDALAKSIFCKVDWI